MKQNYRNYWDPQPTWEILSGRNQTKVRNTKGFRATEFLRPTTTLLDPRAQAQSDCGALASTEATAAEQFTIPRGLRH